MIIEVGYKDEKTTVLYQKYAIHPSKLQEFINALIEAKMFYKEEIEEALPEVPIEEEELPPPPKPKKPSKKPKKVKPKKKAKICPECGHENKPTAKFCAKCGTKLI